MTAVAATTAASRMRGRTPAVAMAMMMQIVLMVMVGAAATAAAAAAALTVAAGGDVMLGTDYPDDTLPPEDGAQLMQAVAPTLRAADVAFVNLEGVLLDGGEPDKICTGRCYFFRSPTRYVGHLIDAGIDLVSLGNNHAGDFGEVGLQSTQRTLDGAGIAWSGPEGTVASIERGGRRIAMVAFAPNPDINTLLDLPAAAGLVEVQAQTHDIVIVSFHGGSEGPGALHVGDGMEYYFDEERGELRAFAHAVVDAGADLVLGHGPHVPRGLELYRDRLIAYSLGNFVTYFGISVAGLKGIAPLLTADLDDDGRFLGGRIGSFRQQRPSGPLPDADGEAFALMRRLSTEDFPDSPLRFTAPDQLSLGRQGLPTPH